MNHNYFKSTTNIWGIILLISATLVFTSGDRSHAARKPSKANTSFQVKSQVALASLMSLSDNHLLGVANSLKTLAGTDEARSADWERIRTPLVQLARRSIPAVVWFALPDGTYWTVEQGLASERLNGRPYFSRLLAGKDVIGDLVVSKSTGKASAIVAVPVVRNGAVVGALGSSIYLDRLSRRIEQEMALDQTMIFYSFNAQPLVGLDWDPQLIFLKPMEQGSQSLKRAFREMLSRNSGTVQYEYRGKNPYNHLPQITGYQLVVCIWSCER